jgi:hypothetical protein
VSIAIGIGGLLVGALALVLGEIRSRREQRSAERLARSARWFDTRREVYEELLRYMHRSLRHVTELHQPGIGHPVGDPLTPELEMQVQVRSEIFGSIEVAEAAKEFFSTLRAFDHWARLEANPGDAAAKREAQREMNRHRDTASDQVRAVEVLMREELASL